MNSNWSSNFAQQGSTMIEVLITIVIVTFGLLGLAGLEARLQVSEMEAYQRAQALILMDDMASRLAANRTDATSYVTSTPVGGSSACSTDVSTRAKADLSEWCNALLGAGEEASGGSKVGAMVGGRGCIASLGGGDFMITVAWQGLIPISAPPASVTCGQGSYDSSVASSPCKNDLCRRVLTTIVRIPKL